MIFKEFETVPQSNFDLNVTKAQSYLENDSSEYVIVGSSMGNRINTEIFSEDFYFLTFSGLSSFDGLEIIKESNKLPEVIFIETNVMKRRLNEEFVSEALNLGVKYLKNGVPSVLKKNKPTSIIHKPIAYLFYGIRNQFKKTENIKITKEDNSLMDKKKGDSTNIINTRNEIKPILETNNTAANLHFEHIKKEMNKGIPEKLLNQQINKLKYYVTYFKKKGVKIIFYEMPIDKELKETKSYFDVKKAFLQEFPENKYNYILASQNFEFKSQDGIHLSGKGIEKYSSFFKNKAENFIKD